MLKKDRLEKIEKLACQHIANLDWMHHEVWQVIGDLQDAVEQMDTKGKEKQGLKALGHACERLINLVDDNELPDGLGCAARKHELHEYVKEKHG